MPELKYVKESVLNSKTMGSNWEGVCVCTCARESERERLCLEAVFLDNIWIGGEMQLRDDYTNSGNR